ncbi:MAG: trehalose-6-phosphate synthase [Phycisphaerales bacterium]
MQSRIVILANRLPVRRGDDGLSWERSPGGLVSALEPILRSRVGLWIGWKGEPGRGSRSFEVDNITVRPVTLTKQQVEDFYHGFSNRTLWPLYHNGIRPPQIHRHWWQTFVRVNEHFAKTAARLVRKGDIVWIHDYHLHLVPTMLRELRRDITIGFFLHIPFPPEELFAQLPWRKQLCEGLLGANLLGFQTQASAQNFSRAAREFCDVEGTDSELRVGHRKVRIRAHPISIDVEEMERLASDPAVQARAKVIRQNIGHKRSILLAIDRLDYTKGIVPRLQAVNELFRSGELNVDRAVLVQVAVPSREVVREYVETREQVDQMVGRMNGEHSQPGRVAVHYFRRNLNRAELVAYYLAADVLLVTPLCDGMNLVAKEFVASRIDGGGMLVLSEFAGAARELRRALIVNPYDVDGQGQVILDALRMPKKDSRMRMAILRTQVRRHDIHDWSRQFLEAVA